MIETVKSIILDFQETRLETGVPRRLRTETVHGKSVACIGMRRSGKPTRGSPRWYRHGGSYSNSRNLRNSRMRFLLIKNPSSYNEKSFAH